LQQVDREFLGLLGQVYKHPYVQDVINIDDVQHSLERLADMLAKVKKSLSAYLEKQRAAFPRFYFVGDEDLLEIIGNSKEPIKILKHLRKIFAGISSLQLDEDGTTIRGMESREGEAVVFGDAIDVTKEKGVIQWLSKVESAMRLSLAVAMQKATAELRALLGDASKIDAVALFDWATRYPTQLVTIAYQVVWTSNVEKALATKSIGALGARVDAVLSALADRVMQDMGAIDRKCVEYLIIESVHLRDVVRGLVSVGAQSKDAFEWLRYMRFYWSGEGKPKVRVCLTVCCLPVPRD